MTCAWCHSDGRPITPPSGKKEATAPRTAPSSGPTSFPRRTTDAQDQQAPSDEELLIYLCFHFHENCIDSILSLGI